MLQDESLLGVLLVRIEETPKWTSPTRKSATEDWVSKDWFTSLEPQNRTFSGVKHNGVTWVNDVEVHVLLFERGWEAGDPDSDMVFCSSDIYIYR
jgi:hypothetical protein